MDLNLLIGIAISLMLVALATWFLTRRSQAPETEAPQQRQNRGARPNTATADAGIPRRAQIARNQRHRPTTSAAAAAQNDSDSDEGIQADGEERRVVVGDEKMGAKKRAKLEAKAERQRQREAELAAREEKKKREALLEEERRKVDQAEENAERKREEAERKELEEKERKEHEEYLKLKATFQMEEEGFDGVDEDEKENLLQTFIEHIRNNKVVVLEDLATEFKLKTQAVIDRITELQENGTLTGVIDDQGKFIYISDKELGEIASFIRQRGRVSITELAESSNSLVNLKPVATVE